MLHNNNNSPILQQCSSQQSLGLLPCWNTATQEKVVPRSIPITGPFNFNALACAGEFFIAIVLKKPILYFLQTSLHYVSNPITTKLQQSESTNYDKNKIYLRKTVLASLHIATVLKCFALYSIYIFYSWQLGLVSYMKFSRSFKAKCIISIRFCGI